MPKATKKPVKIDYWVWDGKDHRSMFEFLGGSPSSYIESSGTNFYMDHKRVHGGLVIKTSEGDMEANIGDYIIKEPFDKVRGFYPCKPDIFKLTYDEAGE
jgi:hypothetical protein